MSLSSPTTPDGLPELMLAKEVAEYLRIPLPTVYHLVNKGVLPGVQIGGRWRIKRSLIDRDVLKKEPSGADISRISLNFADEALGCLVRKQLSMPGMGVMIDNTTPDTIITDDASRVDSQFSGQIIAIIADSDSSLIEPQVRRGSPVTLTTSLQIADPETLRKLMGLAA